MTILGWLTLYTIGWAAVLTPLHFLFMRAGNKRARREIAWHRRVQRHVFGRR